MAVPVNFDKQTRILKAPDGYGHEIAPLPVATLQEPDIKHISCWHLDPSELQEVSRSGKVWLTVASHGHPPVSIDGHSPFNEVVKMDGMTRMAEERKEQLEDHGYDLAYDMANNAPGELAYAAACIALGQFGEMPNGWSDHRIKKLMDKPKQERLVIAGALLAAEVDLMDEAASRNTNDFESAGQL